MAQYHRNIKSEVLGMLNQFPVDQMNAYPISDLVDDPEINDITMLKPIGDKLQADFEFPTRIIRPYRMHKEKTQTDVPWFNRVNEANKNQGVWSINLNINRLSLLSDMPDGRVERAAAASDLSGVCMRSCPS